MICPWRPLALAAAIVVTASAASAQTVVVRKAPPGSTVELVMNATPVGTATVNPEGDATVTADLPTKTGKPEVFANIHVDVCDALHRVLLVERGQQPPPPASGCTRREIVGAFLVRRVTTLVVDVGGSNPAVLLRQGPVDLRPPRVWTPAPAGLMVFGGGGVGRFRDTGLIACGNVSDCAVEGSGFAYTAGASLWLSRYVAAEVGYLRPRELTAEGRAEGYRFTSSLDAHVVAVDGKVGVPAGRVRIYGQGGTNYHRALFSTTQTIEERTRTAGDVTITIPGGTQTFELRTAGWGWQFAGGLELWLAPAVALYGQAGRVSLKGSSRDNTEGELSDVFSYGVAGVRVRIGR